MTAPYAVLLLTLGGLGCHASRLDAWSYPQGFKAAEVHRKLQQSSTAFSSCPSNKYVFSGDTPDSIFDELTSDEATSAFQFMASKYGFIAPYTNATASPGLQSTLGTSAPVPAPSPAMSGSNPGSGIRATKGVNASLTFRDSYLYSAYLFPVNKAEALRYLDNSGPRPVRYAKVVAVRGANAIPDVMEYKVGPLPVSANTTAVQMFSDGQIPITKRPYSDLPESLALGDVSNSVMGTLKALFIDWLGQCGDMTDTACAGNELASSSIVSQFPEVDGSRYFRMIHYFDIGKGSASELHNIPFSYGINTTNPDPRFWIVEAFEFCGQGFATAGSLAAAYANKTVQICRPQWSNVNPDYSTAWAELDPQGPARNSVGLPGPRLVEPAGKRFSLLGADSNSSRVFQWGGWQGHVTITPWTGLQLHDLRFKNERIMYELSLQDQIVAYSGWSGIGQTFYLDSVYRMGSSSYALKPGYDCPETAAYMTTTTQGRYGRPTSNKQSICFFENNLGDTTWRHYAASEVKAVRNFEFVIRAITTLGNYDYIFTISFRLDGSVNVEVHMAGYLQSLYYDTVFSFSDKDLAYGTRVQTNTIGNLHDHLSSWKVDLDILGVNNSLHTTKVKTGTYEEALGAGGTPPWGRSTDVMKYLSHEPVTTETGFKINPQEPTVYKIVNENATNAWGNKRGYAIVHGPATIQVLPDNHPVTKGAAWSKYHLAVTQRKETEPTSHLDYIDHHNPSKPIYSLDYMLNNETTVNTDVVCWCTIGVVHIPRAEDVPLISNIGTSFEIKPVNYFDHLASMDVVENDDFASCSNPNMGKGFNYTYSTDGSNQSAQKGGYKYAGALSSDEFDVYVRQAPSPAPATSASQAAVSAG